VTTHKLPISVLIMTQNEQENIRYAIESVLDNVDQVIVTDSYSTDGTVAICREYAGVELYHNKFLSWADQRNWMLKNCAIRNETVFFLDADEYVNQEFFDEIGRILKSNTYFDSIYLLARYIFLGFHLKHAYGHPKVKRIFRKSGLSFAGEGAREYANKEGVSLFMKSPYIHHDRKPISFWIKKHINSAEREAIVYMAKHHLDYSYSHALPWQLRTKIWIRRTIWNRLPLLIRPYLYFVYRYLFQLGILDGRAGLVYCYLHALWYQSLIDIKILEKKVQKL